MKSTATPIRTGRSGSRTRSGRRRYLLGAIGLTAVMTIAACGGKSSTSGTTTSTAGGGSVSGATSGGASSSSGWSGTVGDTLTVGEQQPPKTINPGTAGDGDNDFTMLAYDSLFYLTPQGEVKPSLAESWKYANDNKELDVTLRSGVKFSDGDALDAKAAIASLTYTQGAGGSQAHYLTGATFKQTGDLTFSISLTTPNPFLDSELTQQYVVGQIISPTGLKDPSKLDVTQVSHGAGPYVFDPANSVAGDHYTYNANPTYYDKTRQYWKKVVVKAFSNTQAALNAAKTGQLDVFKGDYGLVDQAKTAGLQTVSNAAILTGLFLLDRDGVVSKPLGDVKVRQAINYAIDRNAITKAMTASYGVPTTQYALKGTVGYSDKAASEYPYDPAKAKQLLSDAGYPNGFSIDAADAVFVGFHVLGQAVQGQLAQVGIKLNLTTASDGPTYVSYMTEKKFPILIGGYGGGNMYQTGVDLFEPGSKQFNGFQTKSADLEALWTKAAESSDAATRSQLYTQMNELLVDQAWMAPVFFAPVTYFARKTIGGIDTSAAYAFAAPVAWYPAS